LADLGDARGWSEVWAAVAVFEMQAARIEGRRAFFASIADPDGGHKQKIEGRGSLHTTGQLSITVDGDLASVEGSALVWVKSDAGYRPITLSYNHWDLVKSGGRWEIAWRHSLPVAPGNAPWSGRTGPRKADLSGHCPVQCSAEPRGRTRYLSRR
jgi:SnoaL-like domain